MLDKTLAKPLRIATWPLWTLNQSSYLCCAGGTLNQSSYLCCAGGTLNQSSYLCCAGGTLNQSSYLCCAGGTLNQSSYLCCAGGISNSFSWRFSLDVSVFRLDLDSWNVGRFLPHTSSCSTRNFNVSFNSSFCLFLVTRFRRNESRSFSADRFLGCQTCNDDPMNS